MRSELSPPPEVVARRCPVVLGIGGTTRTHSTSERALRRVLSYAEGAGARTELFAGPTLSLPLYDPSTEHRCEAAARLVDAMRRADAIIFATPAYHGGMSGLVKNAIDYTEDMREDERPYLTDRAVGTIVAAYGDQAIGSTMSSMRSITHALRAWPLPIGVGVKPCAARSTTPARRPTRISTTSCASWRGRPSGSRR